MLEINANTAQLIRMALFYEIMFTLLIGAAIFALLIPLFLSCLVIRDAFRPREKRLYPWQRFKRAVTRALEAAVDGILSVF